MTPTLVEWVPRILVGLIGSGLLGVVLLFIKKSWNQSVRLYQDDLVQCRNARKGDRETIERQAETITFLEDRSDHREQAMKELLVELSEERAYTNQLASMIQQQTTPSSPSNAKPSRVVRRRSASSP